MVWLAVAAQAPVPGHAEETRLLSLGVRAGFSGSTPLGKQTEQNYQQYDATAYIGLPWEWYSQSGWGIGTRFLVSAGALHVDTDVPNAKDKTAFISTFVPGISLGRKDGRISLDTGAGFALLSEYKFGTQNMGGPFQFVWTLGAKVALYGPLGLGYWYQHVSDATIYGSQSRGFDLHMVELIYRY
jgi:hypothetical protein